ncbi:UNVERIFIED_CONTAM: hypothetical protein Slati_3155100 [Sesamum latifolium]|uniref:Reverse transcriptase domain-containing protein n=1 Tax=Sesamum latifolium TaxID=2727402 RepID=A0AAW2UY19_9LAMI
MAKGTEHLRAAMDPSMVEELLQLYTTSEDYFPHPICFVPGQLISDNVLLAFELNYFLNTKTRGEQGWMTLKLNVSRAYDKVEWSFLEQVISKLGFPSPFLRLVMLYVSTVSYSFMLGGIFKFPLTVCEREGCIRGERSAGELRLYLISSSRMICSYFVKLPQKTLSTQSAYLVGCSCTLLPYPRRVHSYLWKPTLLYLVKCDGSPRSLPCGLLVASGLGNIHSGLSDPWLPRPCSFCLITPAHVSLAVFQVSELIDLTYDDWHWGKIKEIFWPVDNDIILSIPLSQTGVPDMLIWRYSHSGIFSSEVLIACSLEDRPYPSSLRSMKSCGEGEFGLPNFPIR